MKKRGRSKDGVFKGKTKENEEEEEEEEVEEEQGGDKQEEKTDFEERAFGGAKANKKNKSKLQKMAFSASFNKQRESQETETKTKQKTTKDEFFYNIFLHAETQPNIFELFSFFQLTPYFLQKLCFAENTIR